MKKHMITMVQAASPKLALISLLLSTAPMYGVDQEELASRGLLAPFGAGTALIEEKEDSNFDFSLTAGWSSKHMSEGVDVFGEGGVWVVCPTVSYKDFSFYTWYGVSDSINASETDFVLSYDWKIGDRLTVTPAYEWAVYSPGRSIVHTPAVKLNYQVNDWLDVGAYVEGDTADDRWKSYYDIYAEGSWALSRRLTLSASVLYGFNDGYLGSGVAHGSNTIDYAVSLNIQCAERVAYVISINYSQALTVLRQAKSYNEETGLSKKWGNEFWFASYVTYEF